SSWDQVVCVEHLHLLRYTIEDAEGCLVSRHRAAHTGVCHDRTRPATVDGAEDGGQHADVRFHAGEDEAPAAEHTNRLNERRFRDTRVARFIDDSLGERTQ